MMGGPTTHWFELRHMLVGSVLDSLMERLTELAEGNNPEGTAAKYIDDLESRGYQRAVDDVFEQIDSIMSHITRYQR